MSQLIENIKNAQISDSSDEQAATDNSTEVTWLIFTIKANESERKYAMEATYAKEILRNMDIYALPFVPDFIKGVINRHGDPYTVVDLAAFLEGSQQDSSLFIVLNLPDHQFCIQISDILDFHTAPEDSVIKMNDVQDSIYYSGTIEYQKQNVPIIQLDKIYEVIRNDLESHR
ncbi:MAG: chemotaxis protein CheW [Treponema sp.]|nr:chemotaxis protein CheW [Treponema sp.]